MIEPTGDHVMVEVIETEQITPGGIFIPDPIKDLKDKQQIRGVLTAIGPLAWRDQELPWAELGEVVYFGKFAGVFLEDGSRILRDDEIYAREKAE